MTAWRIRRVSVTASTNDDAREAILKGSAEGLVICAAKQTAGRGRLGRGWESPEGNLYCSTLLLPAGSPSLYGFVASLALYDAIKDFAAEAAVTLKWPNDVMVDGKKIAGILLEVEHGWLIIGVGLNVLHHPQNTLYPCTSLKAYVKKPTALDKVLDTFLKHLDAWHETMKAEGFAAIRAAWLDRAQKGALTAHLSTGDAKGEFAGLDDHGRLRLRLADGKEQAIATGDVFFQ